MSFNYSCNEKDWKLFRQKLPGWQERYMEQLVTEYKALINIERKASEIYCELDKRIRQEKNQPA